MGFRWLAILIVASLVTLGLAAGTAAGIEALLPLMIVEWVDDRWLKIASLLGISFPPTYFAVQMISAEARIEIGLTRSSNQKTRRQ